MTTGLTYSSYLSQMATLAVVDPGDANFLIVLTQAITYAENRIYRDIDFLSTKLSYSSQSLTAGNRMLTVPVATFIVTEQINIITPFSVTNPEIGTRNPALSVSKEYLDAVFGVSSATGLPIYFCPFQDNVFYFGPFPDQNYTVEIVGTVRPISLSATNTSTFISSYLPDLMIMASMIYLSGYQRNFGKMSDDPAMAVSYESQYKTLLQGAIVEEARKKFSGPAWASMSPPIAASPSRG